MKHAQEDEMILSLHFPRCAGTSFRLYLESVFGDALFLNYGAFNSPTSSEDVIPPGTRCIHGHFRGHVFDAVYPNARKITWIRHPVERTLSNYFFFKNGPEVVHPFAKPVRSGEMGIEEFCMQSRMLAEFEYYFRDRVLKDFCWVGIVEEPEASMASLQQALGLPLGNLKGVNDARRDRELISSELLEKLERVYAQEIDIYERQKNRLLRDAKGGI
ncbi:MAG: hypothetical protein ACPGN3_06880 [Opitutales bacterium]